MAFFRFILLAKMGAVFTWKEKETSDDENSDQEPVASDSKHEMGCTQTALLQSGWDEGRLLHVPPGRQGGRGFDFGWADHIL